MDETYSVGNNWNLIVRLRDGKLINQLEKTNRIEDSNLQKSQL